MTPLSGGKPKASTKGPSQQVVEEEAGRLLAALYHGDPATAGRSLAERFPPSHRLRIVDQLSVKLGARSGGFPPDRLHGMLREMARSTMVVSIEPMISTLLSCAMIVPDGRSAAEELVLDLVLERLPDVTVPLESLQRVGKVIGIPPVVTGAARRAMETGALNAPEPLLRLNRCLLNLLGYGAGSLTFSAPDAAILHRTLARLDPKSLPVELHLTLDRLSILAGPRPVPTQTDRLPGVVGGRAESDPPLPPPYADIVALLRKAALDRDRETALSRRTALKLESEVDALHVRLDAAQHSAAEELDRLTRENTSLGDEVARLSQTVNRLEQDLASAREAADVWRKDADLSQRESRMLQAQREEEILGRVAAALDKPAAKLAERIKGLMQKHPGDESLRLMAVTFDNLHDRIQRFTGGPEEDRIPPGLLHGSEGGE